MIVKAAIMPIIQLDNIAARYYLRNMIYRILYGSWYMVDV
jgi:hypothetical protein